MTVFTTYLGLILHSLLPREVIMEEMRMSGYNKAVCRHVVSVMFLLVLTSPILMKRQESVRIVASRTSPMLVSRKLHAHHFCLSTIWGLEEVSRLVLPQSLSAYLQISVIHIIIIIVIVIIVIWVEICTIIFIGWGSLCIAQI